MRKPRLPVMKSNARMTNCKPPRKLQAPGMTNKTSRPTTRLKTATKPPVRRSSYLPVRVGLNVGFKVSMMSPPWLLYF